MIEIININNFQVVWDEIKQWYINCIIVVFKLNVY